MSASLVRDCFNDRSQAAWRSLRALELEVESGELEEVTERSSSLDPETDIGASDNWFPTCCNNQLLRSYILVEIW